MMYLETEEFGFQENMVVDLEKFSCTSLGCGVDR